MAARALNVTMTHAILGRALVNASTADTRMKAPVLAFHGDHKPVALTDVKTLALDVSTIFTLAYLGCLKHALSAFEHIVLGSGTLSALFFEQERIRFHQPSRIVQAKRLRELITARRLRITPDTKAPAEGLVSEFGRDLASMIEAARNQKELVVRPAPVHKANTLGGQLADLTPVADIVTDTRQALEFLKHQGVLTAAQEEHASRYIHAVDPGIPGAPAISRGLPLFLDDVAVAYLYYTDTLPNLIDVAGPVFITPSLQNEIQAFIDYDRESRALLARIEDIRKHLETGIKSGKVIINAEYHELEANAFPNQDRPFPTLALLRSETPFEAIAVDDRALGKWTNFQAPCGSAVVTNSLDILSMLENKRILTRSEYFACRDKLRLAAFHLIPLEYEELLAALKRALVLDGDIQETPEVTRIREELLLVRSARTRLPSEDFWLAYTRQSIFQTLRTVWDGSSVTRKSMRTGFFRFSQTSRTSHIHPYPKRLGEAFGSARPPTLPCISALPYWLRN